MPARPEAESPAQVLAWAEALGEAFGRGLARVLAAELVPLTGPRRRGRPPKPLVAPAPSDKRCRVDGCLRHARARHLCAAHYQAERRRRAR